MNKVLIVDDEEINRVVLESGLSDIVEIVQAQNGREALDKLYFDERISLIILDLHMPELDGFAVLRDLNDTGLISRIPVFVITSSNDEEALLQAYELGAVDVILKPYNVQFLRRRILNMIELYEQRNNLSKTVEEKTRELIRQNNRLVEAMADIVEFRNNESGTHVKRVSGYTKILMEGVVADYPEYKYLADDIEYISFASCLHDLGKIAISDVILNKPEKLTPEEFEIMKSHTIHGYEQILSLKDIMSPKLYEYSLDIVRHHHERYNGKGYPDKLSGERISIWSQVVALADVYDALTTERCYKKAYTHETACEMILEGECGAFNPKVISVFTKLKDECNKLRQGVSLKRILIVDDSEIDRSTLKTMLLTKYDITEADSGYLALSLLNGHADEFDAVIVDVKMPEMNGFEFLRHLGRNFVSQVPVIMCSVEVSKDIMKRAGEFGVRVFLRKPYDFEAVLEKIDFLIGKD